MNPTGKQLAVLTAGLERVERIILSTPHGARTATETLCLSIARKALQERLRIHQSFITEPTGEALDQTNTADASGNRSE